MSTRAEEVAEMIVQGWLKTEPNALNVKRMIATILSSLPEFQPGRELTVDDVKRIWETIGPVSHTEWYVRMAVELNKIRATKCKDCDKLIRERDENERIIGEMLKAATGRDAEWSSAYSFGDAINDVDEHVTALEKEYDDQKSEAMASEVRIKRLELGHAELVRQRDNAQSKLEVMEKRFIKACDECRGFKEERDALQCAVQNATSERNEAREDARNLSNKLQAALKAQPCVGVTKEQVRDAWSKANETIYVAGPGLDHCDLIAAALSPKWIKTSERMPALGASIWICRNDVQNFPRDVGVAVLCLSEDREPDHFFETFDGICEVADVSDWLPRPIPAPPVEEDSELVKELRKHQPLQTIDMVIEIVKKHEKGVK